MKTFKNYICINGRKIELTDEQVRDFMGHGVKLADIPIGKTFKISDGKTEYEFIVLDRSKETTAVILKDVLINSAFGSNNNFKGSKVEAILDDFGSKIAGIIGERNLITHSVDLTSDDGLKDYGKAQKKVSLLTCDHYRKFVEILYKYKLDKYWWLVTPYSTPKHGDETWIKCVSPRGGVDVDFYVYGLVFGVRPFCIFNSNIFVSKEK